ncbi:MAG: response regulator transcription factor [Clostridia bacterium]|nr:response regulator transcription factor [Clostridia bacterium]
MKVLLVEDEKRMNEALAELLRQEGYAVEAVSDGAEGMRVIVEQSCDLAILDVMLPGATGYEIASAARHAGISIPILMLTAKNGLEDKVTGLDSGADDYMTKPFEPRELLARLRAMTRRIPVRENDSLCFADIRLDVEGLQLKKGTAETKVTAREARLLEALIRSGGSLIGREQLALQAFGVDSEAEYNNVEVYLSFLRRKLAFLGSEVQIRAERGRGYHLQEGTHVP